LWWIISSFGISRYIRWIWFCGWRQWWICDSPTYLSLMARECSQRHRATMNSGRTCLPSPEMLLPVKLALA
jgi:hypothetical protein